MKITEEPMQATKILVVDDEKHSRNGLQKALTPLGYDVYLAGNGKEAISLLKSEQPELLITDLRMPDINGIELIKEAKKIDDGLTIIMITAYGTVDTAVKAVKEGAFDYISKPINLEELELAVQRALITRNIARENIALKEQLNSRYGFENIIGESPKMKTVFETIKQAAPTQASILILGESGTGKELIANAIHFNSPRRNGPFIAVHCAALSESLLESELFGHEKGAFTGAHTRKPGRFERSAGGTLFLDEISEISLRIQVKLLRVLQEREFERVGGTDVIKTDARIVAATNANLENLVEENAFREDLFYRLKVVSIQVPPLRDRREDIPILVNKFIEEFSIANQRPVLGLSANALNILQSYSWPGNVRELRNTIESMIILSKTQELTEENIPEPINSSSSIKSFGLTFTPGIQLKDAEKHLILETLGSVKNNKTKAAKILGISRRTLHRKLNEYGIEKS
ncbi:MAG: sigma-54 dependent transcriptional regulator [Candidatus Theseobacter exili]|nr:sigma-54 dependent transcriptional regulator [Candidatus Theseobacter exili]